MRQGIWRAFLVLALLVPLSRLSFGDTFGVVANFQDDPTDEYGTLVTPFGAFLGYNGMGIGYGLWAVGDVVEESTGLWFHAPDNWNCEGFTGTLVSVSIFADTGPFTLEDGDPTGIPATWTGELDLEDAYGTTLFEISMAGTGTESFGGPETPEPGTFVVSSAHGQLTGEGQVVYENPSIPEPSTLTLLGIGMATILGMRFRRHSKA